MIPLINQSKFSMTKIDSAQNDECCWCRGSPKLRVEWLDHEETWSNPQDRMQSFHFTLNKNFQRLHEVCGIAKFQPHSGHVTTVWQAVNFFLGGVFFCMKSKFIMIALDWWENWMSNYSPRLKNQQPPETCSQGPCVNPDSSVKSFPAEFK